MTVIVLDREIKQRIQQIISLAKLHVISLSTMETLHKAHEVGIVDTNPNEQFTMAINDDLTVTYTHEMQTGDIECRHMSVSVNEPYKLPSIPIVEFLMDQFEFAIPKIGQAIIWTETCSSTKRAINVLEPVHISMHQFSKLQKESLN